jgi:hypothetical protein
MILLSDMMMGIDNDDDCDDDVDDVDDKDCGDGGSYDITNMRNDCFSD